jgi:transcriptional regulator with XRE-family HTH domain
MSTVLERNDALKLLSANLTREMQSRGWSIRELARKSKNTAMQVSRITRQENMPAGDVIARLAEALGVTIDSLFSIEAPERKISSKSA